MPYNTLPLGIKINGASESSGHDTLYVSSFEKGIRVLAAFDDGHPALGVTEIALGNQNECADGTLGVGRHAKPPAGFRQDEL